MTLELKVHKLGNSLGILLPKEALAHLKVAEGNTLFVSEAAENSLRLSPHSEQVSAQMAVVLDVMKPY